LRYWINFVSLAFGSAIGRNASLVGYRRFAYPIKGVRNHPRDTRARYRACMSGWDDDDWTGTPPEGRHSASRANPGFWAQNRAPVSITAAGVGVALIILIIVWLL
jgi:hypothetical protein